MNEARARQGWTQAEPRADFLRALSKYSWPGNVRELRWAVERAVLLSGPDLPQVSNLPSAVAAAGSTRPAGGLEEARAGAEAQAIRQALTHSRGNVSLAAKTLDLSRSRLYEKMEELGLAPETFRKKGTGERGSGGKGAKDREPQ